MAKNMYADFKKKLDRIENHIAEEVAPQANELLKESVRYSLIDWYNTLSLSTILHSLMKEHTTS